MSDFYHPMTQQRSLKQRLCIYCGEMIEVGQVYNKQSGVWDGDWFTNHYHPECWDDLRVSGEDEFTPYSAERPVAATQEQKP